MRLPSRCLYRRYAVLPAGDLNRTYADLCIETEKEMEDAGLNMLENARAVKGYIW